jgi:hypothetical protein
LSVWLYGYPLGITSAQRIEQRRVEDLGFRYLAGGAGVDNGALSRFRRRHHGRGIVGIDSTRVKASACRDRVDREQKLRNERAQLCRQIRRWQKVCDGDDGEPGGWRVAMREAVRPKACACKSRERFSRTHFRPAFGGWPRMGLPTAKFGQFTLTANSALLA